jgi:hypothetical protein
MYNSVCTSTFYSFRLADPDSTTGEFRSLLDLVWGIKAYRRLEFILEVVYANDQIELMFGYV